ncbi:hypothetical protein C0J52_07793 [Blattella germanica]|nr:hypothetical protein C0J52_07793 [Blattella germanica]
MIGERVPRKALNEKPEGRRDKKNPNSRWIHEVETDLTRLGVRRWRTKAENRIVWKEICKAARAL